MGKTVPDLLLAVAERAPRAVALQREQECTSFEELLALSERVTAGLKAHGISHGDRVAVWLPNRTEWVALFIALCRLGAILVAVNTRYRSSELEYVLRKSGARMLVTQASLRDIDFPAILAAVDANAVPELSSIIVVDHEAGPHSDSIIGRNAIPWNDFVSARLDGQSAGDPEAPCILFTTSGTTRGPKLVIHRQRSIVAHAEDVTRACRLTEPGSKLLAALPFCGVFGFCSMMAALSAKAPIHVLEPFAAEQAARLIDHHHITHCFGSDEMFARILAASTSPDRPFPSARVFGFASFHAGALELARDAWARGVPMLGLYGSSEVQALFALQKRALPLKDRILGGGQPVGGSLAAVRVRDLETGELAAPGRSGELEIKGPNLFSGYFSEPQVTADAMTDDGFFRTGDLGQLRSDGSVVYEARIGDALRLSGFLVSPGEIEDIIKEMPGIGDAQVIGVEVERQLRPVAFVIQMAGGAIMPHEVMEHCRARVARFKVPVRVWQIDKFPTTASSNGTKIQRTRLRDWALDLLQTEITHG